MPEGFSGQKPALWAPSQVALSSGHIPIFLGGQSVAQYGARGAAITLGDWWHLAWAGGQGPNEKAKPRLTAMAS